MSVYGPEIADVESFKQVLLARKQRFDAVVETKHHIFFFFADEFPLFKYLINLVSEFIVFGRSGHFYEVILNTTHIAVDRHIVVVEDDKQVVRLRTGVVKPLVCQAPGHGAIAYNCHYLTVVFFV